MFMKMVHMNFSTYNRKLPIPVVQIFFRSCIQLQNKIRKMQLFDVNFATGTSSCILVALGFISFHLVALGCKIFFIENVTKCNPVKPSETSNHLQLCFI